MKTKLIGLALFAIAFGAAVLYDQIEGNSNSSSSSTNVESPQTTGGDSAQFQNLKID